MTFHLAEVKMELSDCQWAGASHIAVHITVFNFGKDDSWGHLGSLHLGTIRHNLPDILK